MGDKSDPETQELANGAVLRNRTGMTTTQSVGDDEIDLGQLIFALWRGKAWIIIFALFGSAVGAFMIANTSPTYQADALLQLEERPGSMALPSALTGMLNNNPTSDTEIEILSSRMVMGQAIADYNLDWRVSPELMPVIGTMLSRYRLTFLDSYIPDQFARPGDQVVLDHLVVPPYWLNSNLEITVTDGQNYSLILPDGTILAGSVGQPIVDSEVGFSMTLASIEAPAGRRFSVLQLDEIRAITALRGSMSVEEREWGSGILEVKITSEDRLGAARSLNAIIQAYQRQNVARSAAEAESSLAFIREQLPQAESNLREAEDALNSFRQQVSTIDLSLETQAVLGQITRIEGELAELQRQEDALRQRYTPEHPTYRLLLDERERLDARLANLREQVSELPETQRQILDLARGVDLAQGIYTEFLVRAQEVDVLRASTIGNVRIIDSAAAGIFPVAPRRSLILALSTLLGAMAGTGLVVIRNLRRKGVQDGSELEKLGLPVFATINYTKDVENRGKRQDQLPILALEHSASVAVEGFRSLRTSLHFGMLDSRTSTLTITSSHPDAGKSFVALNLAVVAAQSGQRVCLVDADLRRGQLRRYFDRPRNDPGLAEVLSGDIGAEAAIVQGPIENLYFLSTGRFPPNPSELLMRAEFSSLIDWCAKHFDLTLFDTPPVLAVTDPVIIARNTGATIFVARHDVTHLGEVEAVMKTFFASGLRISGAVLNGFDPSKSGRTYGYSYRYEYKQRKQ